MIFNPNIPGLFNRNRNKADRPVLRPELSPVDWLLEATTLLGLMTFFGFAIYHYPNLPASIPSHFNGSGIADDYSGKSSFWALPGIAVFIYLLMSLIALIPHQFNYTVKITPANALRQYTLAVRMIRYLKTALICLFFYISYATVRDVAKEDPGLGVFFLPVVLGAIVIPVIIFMILSFKHR